MSSGAPLFSIGLLSDVQYADRDPHGRCRYRDALRYLAEAIDTFNARPLAGVFQLGDLVDSNEPEHLDAALEIWESCRHPIRHLLGNHDFKGSQDGEVVAERLGLGGGNRYGERLRRGGWRMVVIDALELSVEANPPGSEARELAERELAALQEAGDPCGQFWNGRAGEAQLTELGSRLADAEAAGERVLLLSHLPAHPASGSERHLCWNHAELRQMLAAHASVFGYFNGHDHDGGFTTDPATGIHYLTFPAVCDSVDGRGAHAVAHFFPDRIELEGFGRVGDRVLAGRRV